MSIYTSDFYSNMVLQHIRSQITTIPTYIFAGDGLSTTANPYDEVNSVYFIMNARNNIICGKRIKESDVKFMVRRINYTANTVYAMYDDKDPELFNKDFFVINSQRTVYKCLFNNHDAPSTVEPTSLDTAPVTLADGYIWQLLFRLTRNQMTEFATDDFIPFVENLAVTTHATPGSVEVVVVNDGGEDYPHHEGTVNQFISNTLMRIDNGASPVNGIYEDSAIFITAGPGVGGLSDITGYSSNGSGRYITLETPLPTVTINSTYSIAPKILIEGDGEGALARAIMEQGEISSVEVIESGENYTQADVRIIANTGYGSGANCRAIISPLPGHGGDVLSELNAKHLLFSAVFSGSESNNFPVGVTFSQYGIVSHLKQGANSNATYTANTFNGTALLTTIQINGYYDKGDRLRCTTANDARAVVLAANVDHAIVMYTTRDHFSNTDNIISESGVTAAITGVVQPNIYPYDCKVLSITNINTVTRTDETEEAVNIILRV